MADGQQMLTRFIYTAERAFDGIKSRIGAALLHSKPVIIFPYRGYASPGFVYLKGRVLEDKGIRPSSESDTVWINLRNMYRRFESDEVPYAQILARCRGVEGVFTADEEGFFEVHLEVSEPVPSGTEWVEIDLELLEPPMGYAGTVRAQGRALLISPGAMFGVISDIDDTVVYTGATSLFRMARTVFLRNAHTRLPLEGVADFYRALRGGLAAPPNPLFYVSSSPWNLYDLFEQFFQIHGLPEGPLILRDWGVGRDSMLTFHHTRFKLGVIRKILDRFPELPFILIGDSGEKDPEIYTEVIRHYPGRILAAYIREARQHASRRASVQILVEAAAAMGSTMLLAPDTRTMSSHAATHGWIL